MRKVMLYRLISKLGFCSAKEAKIRIFNGNITINGRITKNPFLKASFTDKIKCNNKQIASKKKVYFMLNKPEGYVSTTRDDLGRKTVMDLIKKKERLFPVGRLDINTTGMLLITNDTIFLDKVLSPKNKVEKTYLVHTDKVLSKQKLKKLRKGVVINKKHKTLPSKAIIHNSDPKNFWIRLTITEGKYHQIKKMIMSIGAKAIHLQRIALGKLTLRELKKGDYRELTKEELALIFQRI